MSTLFYHDCHRHVASLGAGEGGETDIFQSMRVKAIHGLQASWLVAGEINVVSPVWKGPRGVNVWTGRIRGRTATSLEFSSPFHVGNI